MKKKIKDFSMLLSLMVIAVLLFTNCSKGATPKDENSTTESNADIQYSESEDESSTLESTGSTEKESIIGNDNNKNGYGIGEGTITPRYYRMLYYCGIPYYYYILVDKAEADAWEEEYLTNISFEDELSEKPNSMEIVEFVKHFNISKEDFEKATLKSAKSIKELGYSPCYNPQDFAEQESDEILNADIIYTFDYDIINQYYKGLRENYPFGPRYDYNEAVEKGEYTPQTTDWIDVDQMEADIIAKYGSKD